MKKYYIFRMNTKLLNILSIFLFVMVVFITLLIDKNLLIESFLIRDFPIFVMEMILFTIFHEVLHSIGYVINGAKFKNIYYGASIEKGILYCLCKQNISKKNILISLMFPFVLIGIVTYILSIVYHLPRLLILSMINISGCSGDLIMFNFINKLKNIEFSEFDSEDEFAIYTDEKIDKNSLGLDFVSRTDKLEISDRHKVSISKESIAAFIILLFMSFMLI